jgi:hypothetical protein
LFAKNARQLEMLISENVILYLAKHLEDSDEELKFSILRSVLELSSIRYDWQIYCGNTTLNIRYTRRVWRYQRVNQNPYIEEEQTTQWPKQKIQKDKQRSTKHTHKTKHRVMQTLLKTGGEIRCSRRIDNSYSTSGRCRVNLVTNPLISHEWGKEREVFTTSGT